MAQKTVIEKELVLLDKLTFGLSTTGGASRTLQLIGSASDIDLNLLTVGTGTLKTRASYALDIVDDEDITNYGFTKTHLGTKLLASSLQAPTITEDGQFIKWDNTANTFVLATTSAGLTFDNGLTLTGFNIRLGGPLLANTDITGVFNLNLGTDGSKLANFQIRSTTLVDIKGVGTSQLLFNGTNSASIIGGSVSSYFIINDSGSLIIRDNEVGANQRGLRGYADYSANITSTDYTQKVYTDTKIVGKNTSSLLQTPTVTEHGYLVSWDNVNSRFNLTAPVSGDSLIKAQTFTTDGSTAVFVITNGTVEQVIAVYINGVFQTEGVHYTTSGQNVDFGTNLVTGESVTVVYAEDLLLGGGGLTEADLTSSRTLTSNGDTDQTDNLNIIYANSASPFNIAVDLLTIDTQVTIINIGSATVTLTEGSGVTLVGTTIPIPANSSALIIYRVASTPDVYLSSSSGGGTGWGTSTDPSGTLTSDWSIDGGFDINFGSVTPLSSFNITTAGAINLSSSGSMTISPLDFTLNTGDVLAIFGQGIFVGTGSIDIATTTTLTLQGTTLAVGINGDYGASGNVLTADGVGNIVWLPGGTGDMLLASSQTNSGFKTFLDSTLLMRNVANTFSSKFTNTNTASRTYTLPDASGTIALTTNIPTLEQVFTAGSVFTTNNDITGTNSTFTLRNTGSFGTTFSVQPTVTTISNNSSVIALSPIITTSTPSATPSITLQIGNTLTIGANSTGHTMVNISAALVDGGFNNVVFIGNKYDVIETFTGSGTKHYAQIWSKGTVGLGVNDPTAMFHVKAGTATAGTAPIKLNTGTPLSVIEDGALEYHGSHLYFSIGSTRYQLDQQGGGGSGDMLLGTSQVVTALKEFNSGTFALSNPANTFKYNFLGSAIAADRTVTIPLLAGADTFVMEAFATTLTNKTLGTGTVFSVAPTVNSGVKFTFNPSATIASLNTGSNAGAPSSLSDFDIWGDSTNLDFYGRLNNSTISLTREIWEDVPTTTYNFSEDDRNKNKRFTHASGCVATIPNGLSPSWRTTVWREGGIVTIAAAGTIESPGTTLDTVRTFAIISHRGSNIHTIGGAVGSPSGVIIVNYPFTSTGTLTTSSNKIYNVFVDATSGNIVITLPTGDVTTSYNIKRIDSTANTVTFTGTIDGNSSYLGTTGLLPLNGFTLIYDGTAFYAI